MKTILSLTCLLLSTLCSARAAEVARPMIWVTDADRAAILAKIETKPWAKTVFAAMKDRVADAVARHAKDPDAYLRGLPFAKNSADPSIHPIFAPVRGHADGSDSGGGRHRVLQRYLQVGTDCAVLYYLTGSETYARCAADILHATVEAMVQMKPADAEEGGFSQFNDVLYDSRIVGAQLPIIYDFLYPRLKAGATVYNLAARGPSPFNFAHAQTVFQIWAELVINHGQTGNNHPVLEMPCLALNALAIDDPAERARLTAYVATKDSANQDSLKKVMAVYDTAGGIWPESLQYSAGVSSRTTYLAALLRRQNPPAIAVDDFAKVPLSLVRLTDFHFPNGENIRFGDGPRRSGDPYPACEIAYALALREGNTAMQQTFGALINHGVKEGIYNRSKPQGFTSGVDSYQGPLQLLWYAPEIVGEKTAPLKRTTDELPFAGAVLQRNLSPDKNPEHGLMSVVSGGAYTHSHASGMSLELYGAGEVLGANSGKSTYGKDDHENYRRLFAAANTVIVNGASASAGGWVNLGINTVQKMALEPAIGAAPVSRNDSFTLTSFEDDKGPGAKAKQERLVGLVRTSDTTGYYVDVFRSRSALPNQFHDYLYHNLGEALNMTATDGALPLTASPGRFVPAPGAKWERNRSYLFPGWHFFKDAKTSAPTADSVTVDFTVSKLKPTPAHMKLFIAGAAGREYSQALAPYTKESPSPYDHEPTPVLVIRQHGEAWTHPFAVIYEPFVGDNNSGSIQSVTALGDEKNFAGFKVVSKTSDRALTQYVLVQPTATGVFEDVKLGISFRGRYAVISVNDRDECTAIYLGEGSRLAFKGIELSSVSGGNTAASAEIKSETATLTSIQPAQLVLRNCQRVMSQTEPK